MSQLSYLCTDRKGGIYYYTVNEDNNVVDHGVVVSVDKYQGDKLEAVNKLESAETVDALHIFGERFDLLDGDLAPEWNGALGEILEADNGNRSARLCRRR